MEMGVSMDGLRKNIVYAFNEFVESIHLEDFTQEQKEYLDELGCIISVSLCVYNDEIKDFRMIADEIKCKTIIADEEE